MLGKFDSNNLSTADAKKMTAEFKELGIQPGRELEEGMAVSGIEAPSDNLQRSMQRLKEIWSHRWTARFSDQKFNDSAPFFRLKDQGNKMTSNTAPSTLLPRRSALKWLSGSLLGGSGIIAACGGAGGNTATGTADTTDTTTPASLNALWIPPQITGTLNGGVTTYELVLAASSVQFQTGAKTATYGYNGNGFWGPTLVLKKGSTARVQVKNSLPEDTTTHWPGMLVPGPVDGGPHQVVAAGATWLTDAFTVKNNASAYWYHPHMHEMTQKQLTLGAGGFIIVQDDVEANLRLPRTYGVDDIPLVLTSRRFTKTNGVANQFQYSVTAYGDYLLANGVMNAEVKLPQQMVRLRILNAEIERDYNLGFGDGRSFYVIGNDGGLLGAPVAVTRLVMSPGERYEVMVNLGADAVGSAVDLKSYNGADAGLSFGFAGLEKASEGEFGSLLNYKTFNLLRISVTAATANAVTAIPATLVSSTFPTAAAAAAAQSRTLNITATGPGAPFKCNNVGFNINMINQRMAVGATESWTVNGGNIFGHSFHIHGVQFKIVSRNGSSSAVKAYESGWKDTFGSSAAQYLQHASWGRTAHVHNCAAERLQCIRQPALGLVDYHGKPWQCQRRYRLRRTGVRGAVRHNHLSRQLHGRG